MTQGLTLLVEQEGEAVLEAATVEALLMAVLEQAGVAGIVDAGVQWVVPERSAALNVEHRGVAGPTDVLSFPIDGLEDLPDEVPRQLGDLAICVEVVRGQLADGTTMAGDTTLEAALRRCVVHGALHLLGSDHSGAAEAEAMFAAEQQILDSVG